MTEGPGEDTVRTPAYVPLRVAREMEEFIFWASVAEEASALYVPGANWSTYCRKRTVGMHVSQGKKAVSRVCDENSLRCGIVQAERS